jgi:ParB family transcriptional regulator, chromosome partitioning protein
VARRSGLGKGLGALIPNEVVVDRSSALREVPISSIKPNPNQPRAHFDEDAMSSLAASIKELGVLQPVLVRVASAATPDEFELIAGERRWRAAKRAGLQSIPVLIQVAEDSHSLEQALVENLHRQDLNVLEEAAAYQQLIEEFHYTHDQVATRVGKSRTAVSNILRLLQLPSGVQRLLAEGQISAGHARALLGTPDRAYQESLAKLVVADGLTVRVVEELIRERAHEAEPELPPEVPHTNGSTTNGNGGEGKHAEPSSAASAPARRLPPPGILELEDLLSSHLNTRVKVDLSAKRGKVVVEFATLEDLERIYKLMVGLPEGAEAS